MTLLAVLSAFAQAPPDLPIQIHQDLDVIRSQVDGIHQLAAGARSRTIQQQIQRKTTEIQRRLDRVDALLASLVSQPPPPQGPIACDPAAFNRVVEAVKSEPFAKQQLARLRDASVGRWYNVAQARQLVEIFTFGEQRVDAAEMLYPQIVDPENWYSIYDAFTFGIVQEQVV